MAFLQYKPVGSTEGSKETQWRWSWRHEGLADGWLCWLGVALAMWSGWNHLGRPGRCRQRSKVTGMPTAPCPDI